MVRRHCCVALEGGTAGNKTARSNRMRRRQIEPVGCCGEVPADGGSVL
jgi:hypothetical protein